MNKRFIENALTNGEPGKTWLAAIPKIISNLESEWHFRAKPPFDLNYNYVAPVELAEGNSAVLKIGFPNDKEFSDELETLATYSGNGLIKLLQADRSQFAMLIEEVLPGKPLSSIEDDDEATKLLASVIKKLNRPAPSNYLFTKATYQKEAISDLRNKHKDRSLPIPENLLNLAEIYFKEFETSQKKLVLAHGDLHHDNILFSANRGWLAIDPKGVLAEPEYEVAAMIRNPYEKLRSINDLKPLLTRRIQILADELSFDPRRLLKWCIAETVLSAVWNVESNKGPEHAMRVAKELISIKI